jgi:2-polyprenyl-6-methoxyphenol hydroxylase-like FAD-dependent oxidoreductase
MKIAILGAGIGGLTMAQFLVKNDIAFDLYESSSSIKPVGAGIWMPPNAMQVFAKLHLHQVILARGIPLDTMQLLDLSMKPISVIEGGRLASQYEFPTISIKRHELRTILRQNLPEGSLHLGYECEQIERKTSSISLSFKNGVVAEYGLVIAADGIHSLGRQALGDDRQLHYSGQTCLRGITKLELPQDLNHRALEIWGHGARFGCSPVADGEVYWYAPFIHPAHQTYTSRQCFELLRCHYQNFPTITQRIIEATHHDGIIHTDLFELPPATSWGKFPLILLGDAAHSMTPNLGQGAAMAVEDAYILSVLLGALLKKKTLSPQDLVTTYAKARVQRVNKIAAWARQLGNVGGWQHPVLCKIRNGLLATLSRFSQSKQIDYIYKGSSSETGISA